MKRLKNNQKGFTLIELLVATAIIGMLLSVIMVAFGYNRAKSRDAKRLSDMKQINTGMELNNSVGQGYPSTVLWDTLQPTNGVLECGDTTIMRVPNDMVPGQAYEYTASGNQTPGCDGTVYDQYKVRFQTETNTELGPPGFYYMTTNGFTTTAPF